jgi:hypothetical protein
MALVHIICTRKVTESQTNITFGEGKLGGTTFTGDIYAASGVEKMIIDEDGLVDSIDLSKQLYGAVATVVVGKSSAAKVKTATEEFFKEAEEDGQHLIRVGIVIEVADVSEPATGTHPTLNIETKAYILNGKFKYVEMPKEISYAESFIESTGKARENRNERSKLSLSARLAAKAKGAVTSIAEGLLSTPNATPAPGATKPTVKR